MDQLGLDKAKHHHALRGLRRLNTVSGICRRLNKELIEFSRLRGKSSLRLLDIASGGGDVPYALWRTARTLGLDLEILGLDMSLSACEFAREQCKEAGNAIDFKQCDVVREAIPDGFDVVTCSLFLHHLSPGEVSSLLAKMSKSGRLLLASDLRRCATGYLMAQLACRCLTRSPVVRYDGPQSVANAFSATEMRELCVAAGLVDATVQKSWPCRLLVRWQQQITHG